MDVLRVGIRSGKKPFFNLLFLVEIKNVPCFRLKFFNPQL